MLGKRLMTVHVDIKPEEQYGLQIITFRCKLCGKKFVSDELNWHRVMKDTDWIEWLEAE